MMKYTTILKTKMYKFYNTSRITRITRSIINFIIAVINDIKTIDPINLYGHSFNPIFIIMMQFILSVIMRQSLAHCSLGDEDGNIQYPEWLKKLGGLLLSDPVPNDNDTDSSNSSSSQQSTNESGSDNNNEVCRGITTSINENHDILITLDEPIDVLVLAFDLYDKLMEKVQSENISNLDHLKHTCVEIIDKWVPSYYYPNSIEALQNKQHPYCLLIREIVDSIDDSSNTKNEKHCLETLAVMLIDSANKNAGYFTSLDALNNVKHFQEIKSSLNYFNQ